MVGVRKCLADGPSVLVSAVLWMMAAALLPEPLSGLAVLVLLAASVLGAAGVGESVLVRVLWRARPVTAVQWRILVASVEHLDPATRLWVVQRPDVDVVPVGRRRVVLTSGLLDGLVSGRVPHRMVTALLVGAEGQLAAGVSRRDPAIRAVCTPLVVGAIPVAALGMSRWVRLGWQLRPVVFGVAIVQTSQMGLIGVSVALAGLLALSYLMPRWQRQWRQLRVRIFDDTVAAAGRAEDLAAWLRQTAGETQRDRIVALENRHLVGRRPSRG